MEKINKIIKQCKKYRLEIVILSLAIIMTVISLVVFLNSYQQSIDKNTDLISQNTQTFLPEIFIDVSGSVNKPDLYKLSNNSRLRDVIKIAGGLSDDADKNFFNRNYNLARIINDQEKIYIPSVWEVQNGYFLENPQTLNYLSPLNNQSSEANNQTLININTSSIEELDTLPGIGKITAQKIIDNRPFKALEELTDKKIVNKNVFENIKNLIIL